MRKLLLLLCLIMTISCTTMKTDSSPEETVPAVKICALTFDDGPDVVKTNLVLDKLEAHDVTASFFVVGQLINEKTKPTLDRALSLGCDIQNHSWSYAGMANMTEDQIRTSINDTTEAIEKYTGTSPQFFRPPNLSVSETMYNTIEYPFASGLIAFDWEGTTTDQERANHILGSIQDGAIILLHDVQPHQTDGTLDILIPELKRRGYEIVSLPELFKRKGVDPGSKKGNMWVHVK